MQVHCERCRNEADCLFYGRPADVETETAQNGEWLCATCVPLREAELSSAIEDLQRFLDDGTEGRRDAADTAD